MKWWQGLSNRSRRREGFRSKKMPGTTITFSSRQAWKKFSPSEMGPGRPSRLSQLWAASVSMAVSTPLLPGYRTRDGLQVESRVGHIFNDEAHLSQSPHNIVSL